VVICMERGADLHMAQLMPPPLTISCSSKIQIGFTCLVPAHLGSHGKGPLNGCVCVCVCVCFIVMCLQCFDAVGWAAGRASGLWWGAGMVICLELGVDLHIAQLIPLPLTVSCFSKIQIGFTFLVLAHPGSPGQRAVKCVCVCACVRACVCARVCVSSFIALLLCLRPCYIYIFFELSSHQCVRKKVEGKRSRFEFDAPLNWQPVEFTECID